MHDETRKTVRTMMERTGHVLVVEDFDDIAELDALAAKIADPGGDCNAAVTAHVVYVHGVPVYPLTVAHLYYLDECKALLGVDDDSANVVALWITTIPVIEDELYDPDVARKRFRKWARRCKWTPADVDNVMHLRYADLMRRAHTDGETSTNDSIGPLLAMLSREYGDSPEYWMREAPVELIEAMVSDWMRQQEAQARAYNVGGGSRRAPVAPPPSPKILALKHFRECAERIEAKWQSAA